MSYHQDENSIYIISTVALANWGFVMTWNGTTCQVTKAGATEVPFAVNHVSTIDRSDVTDVTGQTLTEVALKRRGVCYVRLAAANTAIQCGDYLVTAANGYVDVGTVNTGGTIAQYHTSVSSIVGIAMENKAANAGGTVKCLLTLGTI